MGAMGWGLFQRAVWRSVTGLATSLALAGSAAAAISTIPGCAPPAYANLPIVDTGLPVVQIWTTNLAPVVNKENYLEACLRISDGSSQRYGIGLYHGKVQIRGRGNSTWNMPKKGYRLKLPAASVILNMPAHKDWVLLANYADKTLLRNAVGMELSRRVGMPWTPRLRFADVYLNNQFLGNYQIGEKIEVDPSRVAITPMTTADLASPAVEGGYLLQVEYFDRVLPTDTTFSTSPGGYTFLMESPKEEKVMPAQKAYSANHVQSLEHAIFRGDFNVQTGVPRYMDVDSLVRYYLVSELLKNKDAAMGSSVYLHKQRGGLLKMGPLWDFDLAAGNINFYQSAMYPEGWYLRNTTAWFDALMRTPAFRDRVKANWPAFRNSVSSLPAYIDQQAAMLQRSQQQNFARWPILNNYVWPNQAVMGSYSAEVAWLKNWLQRRVAWMDANMNRQ